MNETAQKRALVIDDDEDVLAYLSAWLEDQGFIVDLAHDGNEAMEKWKAHKPELITLDIVMPQKTGVRFYRELKKNPEYLDIPVIITGLQSEFEGFISHRRTAPPDGYISKPFDREELLKTLNQALAAKAKKAANTPAGDQAGNRPGNRLPPATGLDRHHPCPRRRQIQLPPLGRPRTAGADLEQVRH